MKKILLSILLSLVFTICLVTQVSAVGFECGTITQQNSRSWRLCEQIVQEDSNGVWANFKRAQYYYNSTSPTSLDSTLTSFIDEILWIPAYTDCYQYDVSGQLVTEITTKFGFMGESVPLKRSIFSYDENSRLVHATNQMIDGIEREWQNYQLLDIQYLPNGYIDKIITWGMGNPDNPPDFIKTQFTLDNIGRISSQHDYSSSDSLQWTLVSQTDYTYHLTDATNGISLVESISRTYPFSFKENEPMQIGLLTELVRSIWGSDFNINDTKETFTYSSGSVDRSLNYHNVFTWDDSSYWRNSRMNTYSYDNHENLAYDLLQIWNEELATWSNYEQTNNIWEQTTAIEENTTPALNGLVLSAYPNPFKSNCEISLQSKSDTPVTIQLFNAKGQKLYQEVITRPKTIKTPIKTFSNKMNATGVYFIKARQGQITTSGKIVKIN